MFLPFSLLASSRAGAQTKQNAPPAPKTLGSPAPGTEAVATLEADQQHQAGSVFFADGHVDLRYLSARLRADHVEYHEDTQIALAHGNVMLDYLTQHVEANDARYELKTGRAAQTHADAADQHQSALFRSGGSGTGR
jgi:lipopolysaccharide assembly outer membrane protein LptD (OstA)